VQGKLLDNSFLNAFALKIGNIIKGINSNILIKNFLTNKYKFT
jgi:hypothetical protein